MNLLTEFCNVINIVHWSSICFPDVIENLIFATLMKHLQFLVKTDSRKFLPWRSPVSRTCPFHVSRGFAPLSRRPDLSRFIIVSCNSTYNTDSRPKRSWGYYPSLRWCYCLLRRCAIFVQHVTSFTDEWGFGMSQLIGWTCTIYVTVTQIWSLSFLAWGS